MKSCGAASVLGSAALLAVAAMNACHGNTEPASVPPVTSAAPSALAPLPAQDASALAAPIDDAGAPPDASHTATPKAEPPVKASFVDLPAKIDDGACTRTLVALVKGKATAMKETLAPGDVLVVAHATETRLEGTGRAIIARAPIPMCAMLSRLPASATVVRAGAAPELTWANGQMHAHLDVGAKVSPELYMGRLEGTAPVAEHTHPGTWEILAAVDAAGTFTLDGTPQRLAPGQIVMVPPDTKHAWKPDAGSKLVAIQMYDPPGPEQRFVALAAAAKDGGK